MGLRADPAGGGQLKQALDAIIQAESKPIKNIEARKAIAQKKYDTFKSFKSKFDGAQTLLKEMVGEKKFREFKVDLGEGADMVDVTVNKDRVQPGTYSLVINELANRSSLITNGFKDPNAKTLGVGYIVVHPEEGDSFEIYVDESTSSLFGVADAINNIKESPISAAVVEDATDLEKPWRLILSAKNDGNKNNVEFPEFYFIEGDEEIWIEESQESANATIKINDYEIETAGNDIENFLPGVHLKIKGANPDKKFSIKISEDFEKMNIKVKDAVTKVNEILQFINEQNKVSDSTDTRTMLTGDTSLQSIEYRLRNLMHEGFPVWDAHNETYRRKFMHQMGVSFDKSGKINFDEGKFKNALEEDHIGVGEAIAGEMGFAYQLSEVIGMYTKPSEGLLALRDRGLKSRIDQMDREIENKERMVERKIDALTKKFSRLQSTMGALQSQQQYLSATLGGGGGNPIAQLLG